MADVAAAFAKRGPAHCRTCAAKAAHRYSLLRPRPKGHGGAEVLGRDLSEVLTVQRPGGGPREHSTYGGTSGGSSPVPSTSGGWNVPGTSRDDFGGGGYGGYGSSYNGAAAAGRGGGGERGGGGYPDYGESDRGAAAAGRAGGGGGDGGGGRGGSYSDYPADYGTGTRTPSNGNGYGRPPAASDRDGSFAFKPSGPSYSGTSGTSDRTAGTRRLFGDGGTIGGGGVGGGRQQKGRGEVESDDDGTVDSDSTKWDSDSDDYDEKRSLRARYGAEAAMNAAAARRAPRRGNC